MANRKQLRLGFSVFCHGTVIIEMISGLSRKNASMRTLPVLISAGTNIALPVSYPYVPLQLIVFAETPESRGHGAVG